MKPKPAQTWSEIWREWPKCTLCILSNEFCERFSYYGMRTVLTLYFLNAFRVSDRTATICYQSFVIACYFMPLFGSVLADGYIGKFWTIVSLSLLYTAGQITLAGASALPADFPTHPWLDTLGLAVITIGTGGIKPCVSPFGGDQFEPHQARMISLFFSGFYFMINCGAMVSSIVSPLFRSKSCLGHDSCYPLAFGVPALLMVTATVVFLAGSRWYKKKPPTSNVFNDVFIVMKKAIVNRRTSPKSKQHWLEHSLDDHDCDHNAQCRLLKRKTKSAESCAQVQFVEDVKSLLRILVMFLPLPMFFALYDQQGSKWTIQALHMDLRFWGDTLILPDQMLSINAVLILVFIPAFQVLIFPCVEKFVHVTPLRKMVVGGMLTVLAFCIAALVQIGVNESLPDLPDPSDAHIYTINTLTECELEIKHGDEKNTEYDQFQVMFDLTWSNSSACGASLPRKVETHFVGGRSYVIVALKHGIVIAHMNIKKPTGGNGESGQSFLVSMPHLKSMDGIALSKDSIAGIIQHHDASNFVTYTKETEDNSTESSGLHYVTDQGVSKDAASFYGTKQVRPGKWKLYFVDGEQYQESGFEFEQLQQGGVYLNIVIGIKEKELSVKTYRLVPDNHVSILWQLPQIAVLTAGECLFAVTGNEFAYSQAAPSMRSLVQAVWLTTSAAGNVIIVLMELANFFTNMAVEFFVYALIMFVVMLTFALQSVFYRYNDFSNRIDLGEDDWDDDKSPHNDANSTGVAKRRSFREGNEEEDVKKPLDGANHP